MQGPQSLFLAWVLGRQVASWRQAHTLLAVERLPMYFFFSRSEQVKSVQGTGLVASADSSVLCRAPRPFVERSSIVIIIITEPQASLQAKTPSAGEESSPDFCLSAIR